MEYQCKITQGYLSYTRAGQGEGVLLIMGYLARGKGWRRQFQQLCHFYDTVYFDHRGIGNSSEKPAASMQELAEDIIELLKHLGWQKAHIVGVSMGGMIAQHLCQLVPERCLSLSLLATHAGGKMGLRILPKPQGIPLFLKSSFSQSLEEKYFSLAKLLLTPSYLTALEISSTMTIEQRQKHPAWQAIFESLKEDFGPRPKLKTQLFHLWAILKHQSQPQKITLPTLVIQPKNDLLVNPKHSEHLAQQLPNARLVCLDNAGHGLIRQNADQINELLLQHFQGIPR